MSTKDHVSGKVGVCEWHSSDQWVSPKHRNMKGLSRYNSTLIGPKKQAKFENDCILRNGHRIEITQPNSVILVSFSSAKYALNNAVQNDTFSSQGTENMLFCFFGDTRYAIFLSQKSQPGSCTNEGLFYKKKKKKKISVIHHCYCYHGFTVVWKATDTHCPLPTDHQRKFNNPRICFCAAKRKKFIGTAKLLNSVYRVARSDSVNPFSMGTGWTLYKVCGGFRISYGTG